MVVITEFNSNKQTKMENQLKQVNNINITTTTTTTTVDNENTTPNKLMTTQKTQTIGQTARVVLLRAVVEKRIICGLSASIATLSKSTDESLFCFLAQCKGGDDSASHMSKTLLEAFCYENGIYVIKVDNAEKLNRIIGNGPKSKPTCCILIQKSWKPADDHLKDGDLLLTPTEHKLVDYCEEYWDYPNQVMQLPV